MAAAKKGELVPRPPKKVEYEIRFATADARRGWQDLVATIRNAMTETWDFLTRTPHATTPTNYRLKGERRPVSHSSRRARRSSTFCMPTTPWACTG